MSKFKEFQWFLDRIGQRIYRENNFCNCEICVDIWKNGLIVLDDFHARYLFDCQSEVNLVYIEKNKIDE
jgi:hypothetical protein